MEETLDDLVYSDGEDADEIAEQLAALGIDEDAELSEDEEQQRTAPVGVAAKAPLIGGSETGPAVGQALTPTIAGEKPAPALPLVEMEEAAPASAGQKRGHGDGTIPAPASALDAPLPTGRHQPQKSEQSGRGRGGQRRKGRNGGLTISGCAYNTCVALKERKYFLMCLVVAQLGFNKTQRLLKKALEIEAGEGMLRADGKGRRSPGGVFLTLLKDHMDAASLKKMYGRDERHRKLRRLQKKKRLATSREDAAGGEEGGERRTKRRVAEQEEGEVVAEEQAPPPAAAALGEEPLAAEQAAAKEMLAAEEEAAALEPPAPGEAGTA